MVFVVEPCSFSVDDKFYKGDIMVEERETCASGCITCSISCELTEEEEQYTKSLILSSSIFSLMAKY